MVVKASYEQKLSFLRAFDQAIDQPVTLYLIGGAAITLAYDFQNRTTDLDAVAPNQSVLVLAGKDSELAQKFRLYIQSVSEIGLSVPKDWKKHCELLELPQLTRIKIYVANLHDIILGKTARLEPRDLNDLMSLKAKKLIDLDFLLTRLNENRAEFRKNLEYRQNAILLFKVLGKPINFSESKAKFAEGDG